MQEYIGMRSAQREVASFCDVQFVVGDMSTAVSHVGRRTAACTSSRAQPSGSRPN